jgi:hypothetical protein
MQEIFRSLRRYNCSMQEMFRSMRHCLLLTVAIRMEMRGIDSSALLVERGAPRLYIIAGHEAIYPYHRCNNVIVIVNYQLSIVNYFKSLPCNSKPVICAD